MNSEPDDDANGDNQNDELATPARTDHPVGDEQAAENREEEPPA